MFGTVLELLRKGKKNNERAHQTEVLIFMFIDTMLEPYVVKPTTTVFESLKKITDLKARIVMVTDVSNHLLGVVSNGDILRWLVKTEESNLSTLIPDVMNRISSL